MGFFGFVLVVLFGFVSLKNKQRLLQVIYSCLSFLES